MWGRMIKGFFFVIHNFMCVLNIHVDFVFIKFFGHI